MFIRFDLTIFLIIFDFLIFIDLVSRSRPGSRLSAAASRNNSRNGSPEIRRLLRDDGGGGGGGGEIGEGERGSHSRAFRVRVQSDDMRDYAELVDEEGDYSTPSGKFNRAKNIYDIFMTYL